MDQQFLNIKQAMNELTKRFDTIMEEMIASLCALEIEKARLKVEVGSRELVKLSPQVDGSLLWDVISLLSTLNSTFHEELLPSTDVASFYAFKTWVRDRIQEVQKTLNHFALELTV